MSMCKLGFSVVIASIAFNGASALAAEPANLGTPVDAAELEALDFVVMPDGSGLPEGSGTVLAGAELYAGQCLACHGDKGENGINDRLAGGIGSLTGERPVKTVGSYWPYATTVFDYIRRAMPYQEPGSLTAPEVYSLTAYILYLNGIVDESTRLDARSLPEIEMPNSDNFVWLYEAPAAEK